jgi:indolepyruvate decarboxylase
VIAEARRNNQPAYILVPSDYALAPVTPVEVRRLTLRSNEAALKTAVASINERLTGAKSVVALPAFTIARLGLQKQLRDAIEAVGCPFATTSMEKCIIDESHPQFGVYFAEHIP